MTVLYWLSFNLEQYWGPFRLLRSFAFLIGGGVMLAALLTLLLLPRLWGFLPKDHGKAILGKDGMTSAGKPTGAGLWMTILVLPVALLVMPFKMPDLGVVMCLYLSMVFGYLDDKSTDPWGQLKKGLLDCAVSIGAAAFIYVGYAQGTGIAHYVQIWVPFFKGMYAIPWYIYIPCAGAMLWIMLNATNCSDGVDGLAGTLTLVMILIIAVFLYMVIGNLPKAQYFFIFPPEVNGLPFGGTHARIAARWSVMLMTVAGSLAGYLWWNAEPSKVMMGDAGSRFLGLLVGVGVLVTGNPFLLLAVAPVVLVNGGTGLAKLVLLRTFGKLGLEVRPPSVLPPESAGKEKWFVRALHGVRFPLHDHCKKTLHWSNAQVLMRFTLLQIFLTPILFFVFVKIR